MVGTTLVEIREHIEALADDEGEFGLVCGRTGERPVPVAGERFETRAVARNAARAAEQYRTALRRYDSQLPFYDLVVCQDAGACGRRRTDAAADERTRSGPADSAVGTDAADAVRSRRVEFCHSVAAAVFETLSETGYGAVETAVMDAYLDLAERVPDPDDLCLCLLESTAAELDGRLSAAEQADVLARAADRLASTAPTGRTEAGDAPPPAGWDEATDGTSASVTATLARLRELGLVGDYTRPLASAAHDAKTVVADLSGYALSPRGGRLPVLPVALELSRRRPDRPPSALRVTEADDGWRVAFAFSATNEPAGLACARIRPAGGDR